MTEQNKQELATLASKLKELNLCEQDNRPVIVETFGEIPDTKRREISGDLSKYQKI